MTIQPVAPEEAAGRPYVPAMVARGDLVFVSGQIPMKDGVIVDGPIEDQVDVVLANIAGILARAGASLASVVRCTVFLADLADLPGLNTAYQRAFVGGLPSRTTVGATLPGYGVEIDCIAVVPGEPSGYP